MIGNLRQLLIERRLLTGGVVIAVLLGAALLGSSPSLLWLFLLAAGVAVALLFQWPRLGLLALTPIATIGRFEIGTGTEVALNPATVLVPALLAVWVLDMIRQRQVHIAASRVNRPLFLFLLANAFSMLVGHAIWDPAVPRAGNLVLVQLAQWAIFAFSAGAFWLTANLVHDQAWLRRLAFSFLAVAGGAALFFALAGGATLVYYRTLSVALIRSPFWLLLSSLAGGQLLFNRDLAGGWRLFLLVTLGAVAIAVFYHERETASHWVGVAAAGGVLAWLRWPRLRWPVVLLLLALTVTGVLSSAVYEFAGGDEEWATSGGSRLALTGRVIEVTMRNPVTGLGPAAYRAYARTKPLPYRRALWFEPLVSSHNNYVDLFSHAGLLGLGLFGWFAVELTLLGLRLRARYRDGFAAGYVNAMLAVWAGALVLMALADWILPFVYNIGFRGFQASVLVWLFLGGLVVLEQMGKSENQQTENGK